VPTPHAPIAWSYHLGAWGGVGTARTTQSGRYGPEKLSRPAGATERRWGPFIPVPSRGTRRHRWVSKGVKPPRRAGYCWELERPWGGLSCRGAKPPFTNPSFGNLVACVECGLYKLPTLAVLQSSKDQGLALRTHFEALIAACELSGPRKGQVEEQNQHVLEQSAI
jgi:hypothetical protein